MITSSLPLSHGVSRELLELRARAVDLERQLTTGQKAETYAKLGATARMASLSLRSRVSALEGFQTSIQTVGIRIDAISSHLTRLRDLGAETRSDALVAQYDPVNGNQSPLQVGAKHSLNEAISLLNFQLDGHHYFAGRDGETKPVRSADEILNGAGAQAGLKQMISERRQADLGADGLGRLVIPTPVGGAASLSEDVDGSPFGLKIETVTGSFTGATVTGPAGPPSAVDVTFTSTLPQDGEKISISLTLPDGTSTTVELTARSSGPIGPGEFGAVVDENITASNFQIALTAAIETVANTKLHAASAFAAADGFFNYDSTTPPQRVDGPPFDGATGFRDANATDTVFWYKGDNGPGNPRDGSVVRVDDNLTVGYGVRANEEPISKLISTLAVLAVETFDPAGSDSKEQFLEMRDRASLKLAYDDGRPSLEDINTEIGYTHKALEDTRARHDTAMNVALSFLSDAEEADPYEVTAALLQVQNQLEASYQVAAMLSNLSLVKFL
jgi:flagellin-like hook-associated protein FlgL